MPPCLSCTTLGKIHQKVPEAIVPKAAVDTEISQRHREVELS